MMQPIFQQKEYDTAAQKELMAACGLSAMTAGVLLARGMDTPQAVESFLSVDGRNLLNPFLLPDMEAAVERLELAAREKERIAVYGDYDADGVTATTLLYSYFSDRGLPVSFYIPDRQKEGYGLNENAVRQLAEDGVRLIVTVDCGIACAPEIALAKTLGMDVIVTDHHECPPLLPQAVAVIDPKRPDSEYPFCELAGVGVAFKLVCALEGEAQIPSLIARFCDLVAIGTLADVVPLISENRILVQLGLLGIRHAPRSGLAALLKESHNTEKPLTAIGLTYTVVPKINAAGRMGSAEIGVRLLLCREEEYAARLSRELCEINVLRRNTEQEILEEAETYLQQHPPGSDQVCVLAQEGWHPGVLGIVAAKLAERYHTPMLLLSIDGDEAKGSGRSIEGVSLFDLLDSVRHCMKLFGGHAQAVGLTVETAALDVFRQELNQRYCPPPENERRTVWLDYQATIRELTVPAARELMRLEPFGAGNPPPQIGIMGATITEIKPVGAEGRHLKFRIADASGSIAGIGFSMGTLAEEFSVGDCVDVVGELEENEFRGRTSAQLNLNVMRRCDNGTGV